MPPTSIQWTNSWILTKALGRVKFQELRARFGMVQIGRDRDQGEIDRDNPRLDLIDRLVM